LFTKINTTKLLDSMQILGDPQIEGKVQLRFTPVKTCYVTTCLVKAEFKVGHLPEMAHRAIMRITWGIT